MQTIFRTLPLVAVLVITATGCTLSPYHLQRLAARNSTVAVTGYTVTASDTIRVECRKYTFAPQNPPPQWALVDTIVASNSPASGTTDLFAFSGNVVFPNSCWGLGGYFAYATEVRFINDSGVFYGGVRPGRADVRLSGVPGRHPLSRDQRHLRA